MFAENWSTLDRIRWTVAAAVVLLWGIALILRQVDGNAAKSWSGVDPRLRRAWRDEAIAYAGGGRVARELVESRGENAARAVLCCSPVVARGLVAFHREGELDRLPRADDLLYTIGEPNHGDAVCQFMMANSTALTDPKTCDAFLKSPLEYALVLKSLQDDAANDGGNGVDQFSSGQWRIVVMVVATGVVIALLIYRRRMSSLGFTKARAAKGRSGMQNRVENPPAEYSEFRVIRANGDRA